MLELRLCDSSSSQLPNLPDLLSSCPSSSIVLSVVALADDKADCVVGDKRAIMMSAGVTVFSFRSFMTVSCSPLYLFLLTIEYMDSISILPSDSLPKLVVTH
ncbi:unnamed protein product [Haemonchus placei]|uniref:Uncharacterized protein n=1 Tax=Haemonchus placei TaxID=6290 RepID=A0A3P7ZK84_HAEPC|nr:unnamed protein product [Haemonchus placei]